LQLEVGLSLDEVVTVRVTASRQRADEWAVVLAAAGIPHWMRHRLDGWALIVPAAAAGEAVESLAAYDRENAAEGVDGREATGPSRPLSVAGMVVALLLVGFFAITGPRAGRSAWFEHGGADAARIVAGEWWRTVTALTLHADGPHLLGNAVACAILMTAVVQHLGPGVGLWLVLLAGAGGNALTAAVHGGGHVSVGASTAVFGAVGLLATLRIVAPRRVGARPGKWWVVLAAALVLLALLGTGPNADVLAHLFGFLAGAALGLLAALTLRWNPPAPLQWLLLAAAGAAVAGAWRAAF
jgi:membrane associated rhomboid family serine protease